MDKALDRSLDEILADRKPGGRGNRNNRGNGSRGPRRERQDYPRDGVRKTFKDDTSRSIDTEWVHDRFEDNANRRSAPRRRQSPEPSSDSRGTRIRVDNIHYELTEEELVELFEKMGPVIKFEMMYDRAGRSEGTALVTYESNHDAKEAVREFDGANAAGQPIRLTLMPSGPKRNAFDTAVVPGRSLAERITVPAGRPRSRSPHRAEDEEAARRGIDRYRPGGAGRSRSPLPSRQREGGRRPGARRDGGGRRGGDRGGERQEKPTGAGRPRKTQEELDAEMEDYFNSAAAASGQDAPANSATAPQGDDIDMIE